MDSIVFSTGNLDMGFSPKNGALTFLRAADTGWVIHRRPELGLSWQLQVPVNHEKRNDPVRGEKQELAGFEQGPDYVRFIWKKPLSERAGRLDIDVTVTVKNEDGDAVWYTQIDNRSPYVVESVHSPYLGDLTPPDKTKVFKSFFGDYACGHESGIYPRFQGNKGDWGIEYPGFYIQNASPYIPFLLMLDGTQGLYAGIKDDECNTMGWQLEQRPGYDCGMYSTVTDKDEINGMPVHIRFAGIHMCYLQPGEKQELTPVMLRAFRGGWQKGVDIYRKWRDSFIKPNPIPAWAKDPHSWLQVQMNSPEDECRYKYTDLPAIARDCAEHGITAIQLVGWNHGGQDQGNPYHDTDPRLGTFDELKNAIAECHKLGVKIILFSKFTWGDRDWPGFKEEIAKHAIRDPYGAFTNVGGYQYYTPAQLFGIDVKHLVPMCFGSKGYIEDICVREFRKMLALKPAGILYDECQHHSGNGLCFDTSHGHRYGWPVYKNDRKLIERFRREPDCPKDFLFAGEACYDQEFEQYHLSYFRSRDPQYIALSRYERPDVPMMTAVNGFRERNMINQCLMCRFIISYEPYFFKGVPSDIPETVAYGRRMDALRTEERRFFWDGEYRDAQGAVVTSPDGTPYTRFSRFDAADGTGALVVCNYDRDPKTVSAKLEGGKLTRYRIVDEDEWHAFTGSITLPGESAAVIE